MTYPRITLKDIIPWVKKGYEMDVLMLLAYRLGGPKNCQQLEATMWFSAISRSISVLMSYTCDCQVTGHGPVGTECE